MSKHSVIFAKPSLSRVRDTSPRKGKKNIVMLAIETSCDETAAAVLRYTPGKKFPTIETLSSVVKSQIKMHAKTGGVIPEAAARAHIQNIRPVVEKAFSTSRLALSAVDYIAVTSGPGLVVSLMVGVEFAKALAMATGKPLIPVNHMAGHLYSPFSQLQPKSYNLKAVFPIISLIVSGGHTMLVLMQNEKHYRVLGQTVDDAAGEAFDKVARMLDLPYPGGPEVSKLAALGNPAAIPFPRPMLSSPDYNFSFSGLKTAVLYHIRDNPLTPKTQHLKPDICAGFEQAVVDVLVAKTVKAAKQYKAKSISLSGGVAANTALREQLQATSYELRANFFVPQKNLCTDNAEMIGIAAAFMLSKNFKPRPYYTVEANPNFEL